MADIGRALVIGATGNIGRIAVQLLRERGVAVRAMARDAGGQPDGVEAFSADVLDGPALRAAVDGVDAVLLIWPFMDAGGIGPVAAALGAGGRRVVYISAMSAEHGGVWGEVEAAIRGTAAAWTFLRASGFATNTLQWAAAIRAGEPVRIPYSGAARSLVHERDLAEAAVVAMTEPGHAGRTHVLSGPGTVTQAEQVRLIGAAAGVRAVAEEVDRATARAGMLAWATPEFADAALDYWASLVDTPEPVADGVREVTGHPARSFAQWAADHAADFRPPASVAEVAARYVEAFRAGRFDRALALYDPAVVRVAPLEGGGELRGLPEILANGRRRAGDLDAGAVGVQGPYIGADGFAVRFTLGATTKMSLLTVEGGAITREEVHYFDPPA
ncbi:hypothetical protein GCM10020218_082120 [Dactylosporangium vinaceum]|nr:NAD(P)H-binding protein [Dactylosporangium vinaceum]